MHVQQGVNDGTTTFSGRVTEYARAAALYLGRQYCLAEDVSKVVIAFSVDCRQKELISLHECCVDTRTSCKQLSFERNSHCRQQVEALGNVVQEPEATPFATERAAAATNHERGRVCAVRSLHE
eukprot:4377723-Prymnesium_polylepis.1